MSGNEEILESEKTDEVNPMIVSKFGEFLLDYNLLEANGHTLCTVYPKTRAAVVT